MDAELQQLRDIHLPHAISMWPTAPGWIIVYVILSGLTVYLLYILYQRKQRQITVKFALLKLESLRKLISDNPENINIAAEVSILIRRTALHYFHRDEIAGLSGNDWLNFLNDSGRTTQFTEESGRLLIDVPYQKNNAIDLMPLILVSQKWLVTISKTKGSILRREK